MDMSLSKPLELVMDTEARRPSIHLSQRERSWVLTLKAPEEQRDYLRLERKLGGVVEEGQLTLI